jgi:tRNA-dihydrouridine synthase A
VHKIAVAPMMDWTDRHCRYLLRLISKNVLLYTEMVTSRAIIHGDREHLLGFDAAEHPVALQLGGSDAEELVLCAKIGEDFGYDEINLNVGCPSDRVQAGAFGLCLMKAPDLVSECVAAMKAAVNIPVSVKTRIGVDDQDDYESLYAFITKLIAVGVDQVTIHARKGWLKGLSPKENRTIPELNYPMVYRLKQDFSNLSIGINGGITTLAEACEHLQFVDSVMLGRAAYHDSYVLAAVDQEFYDATYPIKTHQEIVEGFVDYIKAQGLEPKGVLRHAIGLYHGTPGARHWRQMLSAREVVLEDLLAFARDYK